MLEWEKDVSMGLRHACCRWIDIWIHIQDGGSILACLQTSSETLGFLCRGDRSGVLSIFVNLLRTEGGSFFFLGLF